MEVLHSQFNIKINNININGEGVANYDNKKVCVKYVLPQEDVLVESVFEKNNFIKAKLKNIKLVSAYRQKALCPYYTKCGGCDFQHINYDNLLKLKHKTICEYFSDICLRKIEVVKSNKVFNYRNKASFIVKDGVVGFQEEGTNKIVEINKCLIIDDNINDALNVFKNWMYINKNESINHFVVRTLNNNLSITLVVGKKPKNLSYLISKLKEKFDNRFGLFLNFNKLRDKILSDKWEHVYGLKELQDNFQNIKFFVHPNSFLQVNDNVRDLLYNRVLEIIEGETIIEGYSGVGLLTSILSTKAKKVIAVEINKTATDNANILTKKNGITNVVNINGDCKVEIPKLAKIYPDATFLVDPPRSGCDIDTLNAIKESGVKQVVYISCNPYTLKQNIRFLLDKYKVENLIMFDMFPQTFNCEILAVLSLKK